MPSLYEILEVPSTATKAEIKRAYKTLALKTHPDRVPPAEKAEAERAFHKINAAYEVLVNDTARQEYDMTGRIPSNSALGSTPPPHGQSGFFNPFGGPSFGFGAESLFNEHQRFGANFSSPFFTSSAFGAFDPFMNDPFFNPMARSRSGNTGGFSGFPRDNFFREFDSMLHPGGFGAFAGFGGPRAGSSLHDPPQFPFGVNQQNTGNGSYTSFYSSTSSTTFRNGKWTSESVEESNINGERKRQTKRVWTDEQGGRHVEETRPDGSRHYLREGENQPSRALPPLPSDHTDNGSSRSGRRRA